MKSISAMVLCMVLASLIISCTDNQGSVFIKIKKVIGQKDGQKENEVPYTTPAIRGAPRIENESVESESAESNNIVEKAAKVTGIGESNDVPNIVSVVRGEILLPENESH